MTGTLDAGRKLDVLIAEKVMGAVWGEPDSFTGTKTKVEWLWVNDGADGYPVAVRVRGKITDTTGLLRYSTDIAAAWLVVEKMARLEPHPWMLTLQNWNYYGDRTCAAQFTTHALGPEPVRAEAETAPLAICRAALAAMETP